MSVSEDLAPQEGGLSPVKEKWQEMSVLWYIAQGDMRETSSAAAIHSREDARGLCQCGWSVTLLACGAEGITDSQGVREVIFRKRKNSLINCLSFSFRVLQYLLRSAQKPDFVFFRGPTNLILVALLCKLMRIPFGQELNGVFPYRYAKRRIANPLEVMSDRFFARNSKVVVSVTNELNRLAEAESSPGTILAVAPNGVNTDQIRPCDKGVRDERFDLKVGYLGKCYQRRGHELMIEAISLLRWRDEKHVGFKLVGGGPNAPLLAEQAGRLGVAEQVEFRPGVAPEKMSEEIADCDVLWAYFDDWDRFLLTGMSPLKIWTYLALGKPFILRGPSNVLVQFRDVPGVLWTHETSVAGLAESVAALVHTDRDHLRRLGIQGRRYVERYGTWQLHAERIDAAIREYFRRDIAA